MRLPYISLIASAAIALGGCAYNGLGVGVGYGNGYGYGPYGSYGSYYGQYPYSRYGYGYGSGYVDPFYYGSRYGYGGGYGMGYGFPYYGWHNGYYYPGSGIYVYDRYRRPRTMTTQERTFWGEVLRRARQQAGATATTSAVQPNWSGFSQPTTRTTRRSATTVNRPTRTRSLEQTRAERQERRAERRSATTSSSERRRNRRGSDDD